MAARRSLRALRAFCPFRSRVSTCACAPSHPLFLFHSRHAFRTYPLSLHDALPISPETRTDIGLMTRARLNTDVGSAVEFDSIVQGVWSRIAPCALPDDAGGTRCTGRAGQTGGAG